MRCTAVRPRVTRCSSLPGVTLFRVDSPHTKPFRFWERLIGEIKRDHIGRVNKIRAYTKQSHDRSNVILVVVNLDLHEPYREHDFEYYL